MALIGIGVSGSVATSLLALAVVIPALLLQDTCRMAMFTIGKPAWAAVIDAAWIVAQLALISVLLFSGHDQVWPLILAWGGRGSLCRPRHDAAAGQAIDPRGHRLVP